MSTTSVQPGSADPLAAHAASPGELRELLATERVGAPFIAFRDEQERLRFHMLADEARSRTLGSRPKMDLSITWDREVSGLHAELQCLGGEWAIVDDGLSRNGTYVNGERVSGRRRLRDGDRIRLGRTVLAFKAAHTPEGKETVVGGEGPAFAEPTQTQRRILIALCRPYRDGGSFASPAANKQIAAEVFLGVDAVRMHLRTLYGKFGLNDLAQGEKRIKLVERAFQLGLISQRDLD